VEVGGGCLGHIQHLGEEPWAIFVPLSPQGLQGAANGSNPVDQGACDILFAYGPLRAMWRVSFVGLQRVSAQEWNDSAPAREGDVRGVRMCCSKYMGDRTAWNVPLNTFCSKISHVSDCKSCILLGKMGSYQLLILCRAYPSELWGVVRPSSKFSYHRKAATLTSKLPSHISSLRILSPSISFVVSVGRSVPFSIFQFIVDASQEFRRQTIQPDPLPFYLLYLIACMTTRPTKSKQPKR